MELKPTRTAEQARAEFVRRGLSIAAWAKRHGVAPQLVYDILNGKPARRCLRGKSHKVAVLLGVKAGVIEEDGDLDSFDPITAVAENPAAN